MKRICSLLTAIALLTILLAACSNDDSPSKGGDAKRTVNTTMLNHIVSTTTGEVLPPATAKNQLTIDTAAHTAALTLNYHNGNNAVAVDAPNLTAQPARLGFYNLSSTDASLSLSGYVDFNEANLKYAYTHGGYRIVSTLSELFYLSTTTTMNYSDTTASHTVDNAIYQFEINPLTMTATVKIMELLHAQANKYFENITARNVPVTLSASGYNISGEQIATTAVYRAYDSATGSSTKTSNDYRFGALSASLSVENDTFTITYTIDHLDGDGKVNGTASASASGHTYSNKTTPL